MEAGALGGPAVLTSLSQGGHRQTQPGALVKGEGGGAVADTGGWLSGSQLKAFEEEVHARFVCVCVCVMCVCCVCFLH